MVILQKEKNTITVSQEIGSREIFSGLDKLKALQEMISGNPSLLSEFISEKLDMCFDFEELKSYRINQNNSQINNLKALYKIDVKPIVDFFVGNLDVAAKVYDLLKQDKAPFVIDYENSTFDITLVPTEYHDEKYFANIKNICLEKTDFYDDFSSLIGEEFIKIYQNLFTNHLKNETLYGYYLTDGKVPKNDVYRLNNEIRFELSALVNCAVRFNKDPFLKVYFSFDENWFSFEAPKNSDSVLLVEIKYSTMLTRLFAESVYNVDKNLFYSFVEKRVLNGLQTKIKNLSKNKLTMSQVLKKDVSLTLLSNEQIMDSLPDGINYKFFKDLKQTVKDEKQIARVTNAVEDKMLEFHSGILEEKKKQKEGKKW